MKSLLLAFVLAVPATAQTPLQYLVLGDSTAAGVGGRYEDGIAVLTEARLSESRKVAMTNLGVSGAQVNDVLVEQMPRMRDLRPDLVLLSVGANDVTHLSPVWSMRRDLRAVVGLLRERNPEVAIVITGSPDMGSPPRIPRLLRGLASCRTKQVNRMFVAEAAALGLTFAPIADVTGPMFRRDRSLFAADLFHPNERGYATWVPVLNAALAAASGKRAKE